MIANSKTVKQTARQTVKRSRAAGSLSVFILLLAGTASSMALSLLSGALPWYIAAAIGILEYLFLFYPIMVGTVRLFARMYIGSIEGNPLEIFYYLSSPARYKRLLAFEFNLLFKKLLILLAVSMPVFIAKIIESPFLYEYFGLFMPLWAPSVAYLVNVFIALAIFLFLLVSLRYYLAPFIFSVNEQIEASEAVYMSTIISKRTAIDFVFLMFSYILQILLSFLLLPAIFTVPNLVSGYVVHCDSAVKQYNRTLKFANYDEEYFSEE